MAGTDDADPGRLAGRRPRSPRHDEDRVGLPGASEDATDDEEINAVNKLLGFLRHGDAQEQREPPADR